VREEDRPISGNSFLEQRGAEKSGREIPHSAGSVRNDAFRLLGAPGRESGGGSAVMAAAAE